MIQIQQIKLKPEQNEKHLKQKIAALLKIKEEDILKYTIVKKSIDARKKPDLFYSYTVNVLTNRDKKILQKNKDKNITNYKSNKYEFPVISSQMPKKRPVIAGSGPAGLFCAYFLAKAGFCPIVLERGKDVENRQKDVENFWKTGKLNPESNVQFGEGGAGTFSDGKLNTLVKDKDGRNRIVLETFVNFGAPSSILYDTKPHIGTDVLCNILINMRKEIIKLGGEFKFQSKVTDIIVSENKIKGVIINDDQEIFCDHLILAIGHSARDTFEMLFNKALPMSAKSFAVGFRVEHPQDMINLNQYGEKYASLLPAAPYKLTAKTSNQRGVYSFCMCPGGYVVNASSEEGRLAVNGMSYSGRNSGVANSAIIVAITPADFASSHPLAGISFQRTIEEKAFRAGNGAIPVQKYLDFNQSVNTGNSVLSDISNVAHCHKGNIKSADLSRILPNALNKSLIEGMASFDNIIPGFAGRECLMSGIESRTSSPVRIHRNEAMQTEVKGIYPCGEGAGYAGGITSAAMDGIRIAEAVAKNMILL